MACKVKYKGKEYSEDEYSNVVGKLYNKVVSALKSVGIQQTKAGLFETSVHDTPKYDKQLGVIGQLNKKYKKLSIDEKSVIKQIVRPSQKNLWELNLNGVIPIYLEAYNRNKTIYGDNSSLFNNDGEVLYQIRDELKNNADPIKQLETKLISFLKQNGIRVEVLDTLKERLGVDAVGAYNVIEKLVLLSKDRDITTLPEETGHVIVETLGNNHPLIKMLISELKKTDYKSLLNEKYLELYKNDEAKLLHEAAGKVIGEALTKGFTPKVSKFKERIEKIMKFFKRIFNLDTTQLKKDYGNIYASADEIAKQVLTDKFVPEYNQLSQTIPTHPWFYQVDDTEKKKKIVDPDKIADEEVYELQRTRVKYLENKIKKETNPGLIAAYTERIEKYKELMRDYESSGKRGDLIAISRYTLNNIETLLVGLETGDIKKESISGSDIDFMYKALDLFRSHPSLSGKANELREKLKPLLKEVILVDVQKHRTEKKEYTWEDIMEQETDINSYTKHLGALSDTESILGSSIGAMIKSVQNRDSNYNQKIAKEIEAQTGLLKKVQASRGVSEENMYDIFIFEGKKTTSLVTAYNKKYWEDKKTAENNINSGISEKVAEGKAWFSNNKIEDFKNPKKEELKPEYRNENYFIIQNDKGLKAFHDFYKSKIEEASNYLPIDLSKNFIANIAETSIRELIKNKGLKTAFINVFEDFARIQDINEDLDIRENSDAIPLMFLNPLKGEKKSKDLGNSLNVFMRFAHSHNSMTDVLPRLRLLQETVASKSYRSAHNKSKPIKGIDSNLHKMIDLYIEMQVRGKMKKDSDMGISWQGVDSEGKKITKKIHLSTIGDRLLGYNSLLRIGLNPINAASNIIIGDINNFMEGFGGQFFDVKDLHKATTIFTSQMMNTESKLYKVTERLNYLQELDDYDALTGTAKKMSKEKAKEFMYILQKKGEFFLQARPTIASMLRDKIKDKNGNSHSLWDAFDDNGDWKTEQFGELTDDMLDKMSNRIQRINQIIHGRYSSRDAATASQHILFRAIFQFRKWIPSALEVRFSNYKFDNRLGEYVEGRWQTLKRLVLEGMNPNKRSYMNMIASLIKDRNKLESGVDLTPMERANMRKNAIEAVLIAGTIVLGYLMLGGDDDKDKITNPFAKALADQLNRVSGDLLYFMNPSEYVKLGRNAIPVAKTLNDIKNTLLDIPYMFGGEDSEYRSGIHKGENRFWQKLGGITPLGKPITDIVRLFNEEPYIKPNKP